MTRIEYAQTLVDQGLDKATFTSLMEEYDNNQNLEKELGVAEETAGATPQEEAVSTDSRLEDSLLEFQSSQNQFLNSVSPQTLQDGEPGEDEKKKTITTTAYDLQGLKDNENFTVDDSLILTNDDGTKKEVESNILDVISIGDNPDQLNKELLKNLIKFSDNENEIVEKYERSTNVDGPHYLRTNYNSFYDNVVGFVKTDQQRKALQGETEVTTLIDLPGDKDMKGLVPKKFTNDFAYIPILSTAEGLKKYNESGSDISIVDYLLENGQEGVDYNKGTTRVFNDEQVENTYNAALNVPGGSLEEGIDLPEAEVNQLTDNAVILDPLTLEKEAESIQQDLDTWSQKYTEDYLKTLSPEDRLKAIGERESLLLDLQNNSAQLINIGIGLQVVEDVNISVAQFDPDINNFLGGGITKDENGKYVIKETTERQYSGGGILPLTSEDVTNKDNTLSNVIYRKGEARGETPERGFVKDFQRYFGYNGLAADFEYNVFGKNDIILAKNGVYNTTDGDVWWKQKDNAGRLNYAKTLEKNGFTKEEIPESVSEQKALLIENGLMKVFQLGEDYETYGPGIEEALNWAEENKSDTRQTVRDNGFSMYETYTALKNDKQLKRKTKQLADQSLTIINSVKKRLDSKKTQNAINGLENWQNNILENEKYILNEYKTIESYVKKYNEDIASDDLKIQELNKEYEEKLAQAKLQMEDANKNISGEKAIAEQERVIKEFEDYVNYDYRTKFEELEYNIDQNVQGRDDTIDMYDSIYAQYIEDNEKYQSKYNEAKDLLEQLDISVRQDLQEVAIYQNYLGILEYQITQEGRDLEKLYTGAGQGNLLSPIWNSFATSFTESVGGSTIILTDVARGINQLDKLSSDISSYVKHSSGLISDKEYQDELKANESEFEYEKSNLAASRQNVPMQVKAAANQLKDMGIDPEYAEWYASTWIGGTVTTLADMVGAYMGSPMAGSFGGGVGLGVGFFKKSLVRSQDKINGMKASYVSKYMKDNGVGYQEGLKAFNETFSENKQMGYAYAQAIVEGTLSYVGGRILGGTLKITPRLVNGLTNQVLAQFASKGGGKITTQELQSAVYRRISKMIGDKWSRRVFNVTGRTLGGGTDELLEESSQEFAAIGIDKLFETFGTEGIDFDIPDITSQEFKNNMVHLAKISFTLGGLSGMVRGAAMKDAKVISDWDAMSLSQRVQAENFLSIYANANRSVEQYKQERARVQSKFMSDPNFTKEMRDNELAALDANHKIWQEINPSLTGRAQNDIHALMKMKQRLEDGVIGNINDAQNKNTKKQIDNINKQIEKVVDNEDNYRRSFDDKTAIEAQQDIGQRIMDRRGGGKITFANDQGSFEQAIDESGIAGQEFDNEGNLIQDNTQADALYAMDGSGNIVVNLDRMKDLSSISAVTHEIFHEITEDQLAGMSEQERDALVEDFKKLLNRTERAAVQTRLDLNYNGDMSTSIEWLNAFHDAIVLGNLKYRPGLGNKAGNWIVNNLIKPFAPTAFKEDLSFDSAKGVYNFLKKYSLQTREMMEGSRQDFSDEIGEVVYTRQNTEDGVIREMPESLRAAASRSNIQGVANTANVDLNNNSQVRKFAEDLISRDKDGNIVSDIKQSVLFDEFGGVFEDITKLTYDNQTRNRPVDPETGRQSELLFTREEYKDALGALSVQLLQNEFVNENLGSGQSIDDFLRNRLYLRGYAFPSELGIVSETVTAPEPDIETAPDEKQIPQFFLKDRLGETASEVDTKMKKEAAKLSTKDVNTTYKKTPKLAFKETVGMFMSDPNAVYESGPNKGEKILDSIINKIENNKDLNQQDIKMLQPFINKNADALISSLAEGATPSGKSTGIQNVLLKEFYTKTQRAKMAKTGSKQGLPIQVKNQIDRKDFLDLFGITPTGEANIRNINKSSQAMKALIVQANRIMSNQAIRSVREDFGKLGEGRSKSMRSQSGVSIKSLADNKPLNNFFQGQEFTGSEFNSYGSNWNSLVKQLGLKPLNSNNENDIKDFENFIVDKLISKLPFEFFTNGTLLGAGATNVKVMEKNKEGELVPVYFEKDGKQEKLRKYFLKDGTTILNSDPAFDKRKGELRAKGSFFIPNAVRMKELLDRKAKQIAEEKNISVEEAYKSMFAKPNPNIDAALTRVDYTEGTGTKRKLNEQFFSDIFGSKEFEEFNKKKLKGLKEIFNIFEELIKDDKTNAKYIAAVLSTTSGNMNHFVRIAAPVRFYDNSIVTKGGVIVEEHTLPATLVAQYLFSSAVKGKVDSNFKNINKNYFQGALSKENDLKLKGDGFNYTSKTPAGWTLEDNIWARYFNSNVGNNNGGINPSDIKLEDGKTVAELFDVDVKGVKQTPDLTQYQNTLIEQKIEDPKLNTKGPMASFSKISNDKQNAKLSTESNIKKSGVAYMSNNMTTQQVLDKARKIDEALRNAKGLDQPVRKIRVFDFDDTVGTSKNIVIAKRDGNEVKLNAEEFAKDGLQLIDEGWEMDFSDFNKVTDGGKGPLFDLMKTINEAEGKRDVFILTARAPQAAEAIHKFLKESGIDIPLENITGLGNSTGEAKANWIIDKAAEGYNDFYFADDAPQNVKAVRDALNVIDVKSQVQQARSKAMMSSSQGLSEQFNKFIEASTGVEFYKTFSDAKAKVLSKDKFKFFIPASAEDFLGLLYTTLAKGKQGEEQLDFYKETLIKPYSQAMSNLMTDQVQLMDDFKKLKKKLKVPKDLRKTTKSGFTNEQAVRVYLYTAEGHDVPGLSNRDLTELLAVVENNPDLKVFAEQILSITKGDGYVKPDVNWLAGTITTDLVDLLKTTKRPKYLETWQANIDAIFSKENLNKLESIYGSKYVEALKNIIGRMKTGSNRAPTTDRLTNAAMDWLNGSIGTIMFFNMRSALLQGISTTNFMNWTFNNPARMGKALANIPQFAKDFLYLINSDYLVARRNGLKLNISESEIADAAKTSKNKAKAIINYIIEKGYLPTKFMDSFAIASGGATFYRNRINDLIKNEGKTEAEAEAQAFEEFMQKSEESQQSSDPSRISQQQTTLMGRLLLQFVNTPMQYARLQKRSFQDLVSGRGDAKEHIGKIMYYGVIQNLWFNAMQQGLFLLGFGDDEEEEDPRKDKKIFNTVNGMFDSILRGLGLGGMLTSVIKNFGIDIYERTQKSRPEYVDAWIELLQVSPSIRKKLTNIKNAGYAFDSKKKRQEILDKGFSIDNPAFMALAQVLNTATNVPLDRVLQKAINIQEAFAEETTAWEMIFMLSGWPSWDVKPKESKQETKTIVVDGKLIEVPKTTKRKEQQPWWKEKEKKKPVVRKRIISE